MLTLTIKTDSAAFYLDDAGEPADVEQRNREIARILRRLANIFDHGTVAEIDAGVLRDGNGNSVGTFQITR